MNLLRMFQTFRIPSTPREKCTVQINKRKMILPENEHLPTWLISIALIYNYAAIKMFLNIFGKSVIILFYKDLITLYCINL